MVFPIKCLKTTSDIHGRGNHDKEGMVMPNEVCKKQHQQLNKQYKILGKTGMTNVVTVFGVVFTHFIGHNHSFFIIVSPTMNL